MPTRRKYITAVTLHALLLVIGFATYCSIASTNASKHYSAELQSDLKSLEASFKTVEASTSAQSFDTPDAPIDTYVVDISAAEQSVATLERDISSFETKYKNVPKAPLTELLPLYNQAVETSKNVSYMATQTRSVLQSYSKSLAFLRNVNALEVMLENELNAVNSVANFDALLFNGQMYRDRATALREQSQAIQVRDAPVEYQDYTASLRQRSTELADLFDSLATGLDVVSDDLIYSTTPKIEALTSTYFVTDKPHRFDANQTSLTLKQVSELSEKLDTFDTTANGSR